MEPPAKGGLPAETVNTVYDKLGNPVTTLGYNAYVSASSYNPYGEPSQYTLGPSNVPAWLTYGHDEPTRRVTGVNFSAQKTVPQIDDTTYTYSPAGNITRSVNVQGPAGPSTQTQCYHYDPLDRLTEAWSATDNCAGTPTTAPGKVNIGGANPYWTTWQFDKAGLRTSQVQHAVPGMAASDTATAYSYPTPTASQPHTLTSTTTTSPTGNSSTGYGYDHAGNTITRTTSAGQQQALTWDFENKLATVASAQGETSFVNDADGNQLVRRDPATTTLFLDGEELARNNATGVITGTRYYRHNGAVVALRVGGANPQFLVSDLHDTKQVAIDSATFAAVRKPVDPYGNSLAAAPSTWPDAHGFLDKPLDQVTGLTDVGARKYDTSIGRFISRDPLTEPSDPTQLNGYAYGGDNPVNQADPTGKSLWSWVGDHIGTIALVTAIVVAVVVVAVVAAPALAAAGAVLSSTASTAAAAAGAAVETSTAAAAAASATEGAVTAFAATGSPMMAAVGAASNAITTAAPALLGAGAVGTTVAAAGAVVSEFVGASNSLGPRGGGSGGCNSFAGDTPVLMADGSAKAIEDIRVGDTVTNSEPGSDREEQHTVTAIHVTDDDRAFVDLTVDTADGPQTITTTAHHSFYDVTTHSWTDAENLRVGDELQAPGGARVKVIASRHYTAKVRTYNLTIDHVHTYYVEAGHQPVLVHNIACLNPTISKRSLDHIMDDHGPGASQTRRNEQFVGEFDDGYVYSTDALQNELLKIVRETPDSANPNGEKDTHAHFWDYVTNGKPLEVGDAGINGGRDKIRTNRVMVIVDEDQKIITAMPYDPHYQPIPVSRPPLPSGKDHYRPPGTNLNMS